MLAEPAFGAAADAPARIASGMIDPRHLCPKMAERGGLDDVTLPQRQRGGDRASGDEARRVPVDVGAGADQADAIDIATRRWPNHRGGGAVLHAALGEQGPAAARILAKRGELGAGESADRLVELKPGPRHVLRVGGNVSAPFDNRDRQEDRGETKPCPALERARHAAGKAAAPKPRRTLSSGSRMTG